MTKKKGNRPFWEGKIDFWEEKKEDVNFRGGRKEEIVIFWRGKKEVVNFGGGKKEVVIFWRGKKRIPKSKKNKILSKILSKSYYYYYDYYYYDYYYY